MCKARTQFVAFKGGYHGDTTGRDGGQRSAKTACMRCSPDCCRSIIIVDLPDDDARAAALDKLLAQRAGDIAGIIVEPLVQGAGGMKFHDAAVLKRLRALADKYDVLLIFDEIFTGFGRTGRCSPAKRRGVTPDIITLSKALTGGTLRLAATVATSQSVRRLLVGRSEEGADAWTELHGQCAGLRRGQCLARSVRTRAAAAAGRRDLRRAGARARTVPRHARRQGCARHGRHRRGRDGRTSTISMPCARVLWTRACSCARSAM